MRYGDFMWKGELASEKGIIIEKHAQYIKPQERVEKISVPGRSGMLTRAEGDIPVFENVIYSPICYLRSGFKAQELGDWLSGRGQVIFGSMPERAYEAHIVNQVPFAAIDESRDGYKSFSPLFDCNPLAFEAELSADIVMNAPGFVQNPANFWAWPVIKILGNGDISLNAGDSFVTLSSIEDGVILDSLVGDAFNLSRTALLNSKVSGRLPRLKAGANAVSFSGDVVSITITPMWRYL